MYEKHITFNKGEYVGHLEPTIEDIDEEKNLHFQANPDAHTANSNPKNGVRTSWTRSFYEPPHYKLKPSIEAKLEALLKEYAS